MANFPKFNLSSKYIEYLEKNVQYITSYKDSIDRVSRDLGAFLKGLEQAKDQNEFLDYDLAIELHDLSIQLLEICKQHPQEVYVPFVLGAIDYFIQEEDANHDFDAIDGFDDDREVLEAVMEHFNLNIQIKKSA